MIPYTTGYVRDR